MIKVEKLKAQGQLLSLLHREVAVKNISLADVEVLLETNPNGKGNWDFIADIGKGTSTGAVKDFFTLKGMDLQSRLTGKELTEIGSLVGAELPSLSAFDVRAKLSGSSKAISLDNFSAMVEKRDFKGLAKIEFLKRPTQVATHFLV